MNIYYIILAQIFRFALRALAVYLNRVGVGEDQQNEFVEITIGYLVPVVILIGVEGWSFLKNRYLPILVKTALEAPPSESLSFVKWAGKNKTRTPVIY